MKRGFTLLEMIVTIVILGILSAGTFVSLQHLYLRSAKSKALSDLSSESQVIVDQLSALMYDRVPSSVIGYDGNGTAGLHDFKSIYALDNNFTVLEWIGVASESHKLRAYSGFIDMNASDGTARRLSTPPSSDQNAIEQNLTAKFGGVHTIVSGNDSFRLVFAGAFDDGAIYDDFNNTFGWHSKDANKTYSIESINGGNIILKNTPINLALKEIHEKYYLVDSAYAVALGRDVNTDLNCSNLDINTSALDYNNTLLLFYNYRPWKSQTFCADRGTLGAKEGNVTILSKNVSGFEAGVINGSIYFNITMNKKIRASDNNVTISKQKAVY